MFAEKMPTLQGTRLPGTRVPFYTQRQKLAAPQRSSSSVYSDTRRHPTDGEGPTEPHRLWGAVGLTNWQWPNWEMAQSEKSQGGVFSLLGQIAPHDALILQRQ